MQTCDRCGVQEEPDSYDLLDYCAVCSTNLCDKCMKKGCCGNTPAKSGTNEDINEDFDGEEEEECTSQPPDTDHHCKS